MVTHDIVAALIDDDQFSTDVAQIDRRLTAGFAVKFVSRGHARRLATETGLVDWAEASNGPTLFLVAGGARFRPAR